MIYQGVTEGKRKYNKKGRGETKEKRRSQEDDNRNWKMEKRKRGEEVGGSGFWERRASQPNRQWRAYGVLVGGPERHRL